MRYNTITYVFHPSLIGCRPCFALLYLDHSLRGLSHGSSIICCVFFRMRELICLLQRVGMSIFSVTGITFESCLPCMGRDACGSSWSVSARTSWDTTRSFMVCPPYEYVYVLQNCCGQRRFFRRYRKCRVSRPCEFSCAY